MNIDKLSTVDRCIIIDEWIFNERDRQLMKRKLIDGLTHEQLAERFDMSVRGVNELVKRCIKQLNKHI